jgi:hypothetical protein
MANTTDFCESESAIHKTSTHLFLAGMNVSLTTHMNRSACMSSHSCILSSALMRLKNSAIASMSTAGLTSSGFCAE